MDYQEALDYIHGTYKFGSKLGLENITYLLKLMGNPHKDLNVIHVAGTNGKGSTSSYISSMLMEQGYRVGLYTSPFLEEFTERIRVNGVNIPKTDLAEITSFAKEKVDEMVSMGMSHPTEFEVVTAIGFQYFKKQQVDLVVLEVGLGGRGDSTNVMDDPLVSVITPIDMDHIEYLGDTLAKIAFEKAGIIKENCPVVAHPQKEEAMAVLESVCKERNVELSIAPVDVEIKNSDEWGQTFDGVYGEEILKDLKISMLGQHQVQNAMVALTALRVLEKEHGIELSKEAIYSGLKKAIWPGRLEIMERDPIVLIDGAHNLHGIQALSKALTKLFSGKRIILTLGILGDKDVSHMLDEIVPQADGLVLTKPNNPRAMAAEKLGEMVKKYDKSFVVEESIKDAVEKALSMAEKEDVVVFAGSLYMIGEVRTVLRKRRG